MKRGLENAWEMIIYWIIEKYRGWVIVSICTCCRIWGGKGIHQTGRRKKRGRICIHELSFLQAVRWRQTRIRTKLWRGAFIIRRLQNPGGSLRRRGGVHKSIIEIAFIHDEEGRRKKNTILCETRVYVVVRWGLFLQDW